MRYLQFLILIILIANRSLSQDVRFSLYDKAPLQLNPTFAGAMYMTQANLNYRTQWSSVGSKFQTFAGAFDQRIGLKKGKGFLGLGINALFDQAGLKSIQTLDLGLNFSGHIRLGKTSILGVGAMVGYKQITQDDSRLQWGSQYDGQSYNSGIVQGEFSNGAPIKILDVGAGVLYQYDFNERQRVRGTNERNIQVGVSVYHLTFPSISNYNSEYKLPLRFSVHGNSMISLKNSKWAFGPNFLFQYQNKAMEIVVGTRVRYSLSDKSKYTDRVKSSFLSLGANYRFMDALTPYLMYEYQYYSIGIAYDINISKLTPFSKVRGSTELFFRFAMPAPQKAVKYKKY